MFVVIDVFGRVGSDIGGFGSPRKEPCHCFDHRAPRRYASRTVETRPERAAADLELGLLAAEIHYACVIPFNSEPCSGVREIASSASTQFGVVDPDS
jgi:hypothetical protein